MTDVLSAKREARQKAKAVLSALSPEQQKKADAMIADRILSLPLYRTAKTVFLYVSTETEPDTRVLLDAALSEGKAVYVPKTLGPGKMAAVRIDTRSVLTPGALGIPEPPLPAADTVPDRFDLVVVPCVSCTKDGARLGHGKGFYDAFLAAHPSPTVCLCYEALLSDCLPLEAHDVKMDFILTESALYERVRSE